MNIKLRDDLTYVLSMVEKMYSVLDAIRDNEKDSSIDKKDRINEGRGYTQELNYNFEELKEVVSRVVKECIDYYWKDEGR